MSSDPRPPAPRRRPVSALAAATLAAAALAAAPPGAAQEPAAEPLLVVADGRQDVAGAVALEVRDLAGTVALRIGRAGELRFASRLLDNRREEAPVELRQTGSTLVLAAPEADRETRRLVEVTVPPELSTHLALTGAIVRINGLQGDLSVDGRDLDLDARGLLGALSIRVAGGQVTLVGIDRGVDLQATDAEVRLEQVAGLARLTLRRCRGQGTTFLDAVELDLDETTLRLEAVLGVLEGRAFGGELKLQAPRGGATLALEGTKLTVAESEGVVEVDTDAAVEFSNLKGPLTVRAYGAPVRGSGSTAHVEVETTDADVAIEGVTGPVTLRGDGLRARLAGLRNAVRVETQSSELLLEDLAGAAEIRNDYGTVVVRKAAQQVDLTSSGGEVIVEEQSGPLRVDADGPRVAVGWAELSPDRDSTVVNRGGEIEATFPVGGNGCAIVAQSEYGAVLSSIPGLDPGPGATALQGALRNSPRPKVELNAGGDIRLDLAGGARAPAANQ